MMEPIRRAARPGRAGSGLLAALAFALLACDSGNPVAPASGDGGGGGGGGGGGTATFTVTVSASPVEILAGGSEPSTLTIVARRTDNQQSPPNGTQVTVTVDNGSLGVNNAQSPVQATSLALTNGQAQVSLFPAAQPATANVLAQVGQSSGRGTVSFVDALPRDFFLTEVSPREGQSDGGDQVTVLGAGFREPLRVTFGGISARVVRVPSTSAIVVETPAPANPPAAGQSVAVDVTVTNALNDPSPPTDTLAGGFVYSEDAPPTPPPFFLTGVNPVRGAAGGGNGVRILGGGFRSPVRVEFGGRTAEVTSNTSTEIRAITPAPPTPVAAGSTLTVDVTVTNALTDEAPATATLPQAFIYDGGPAPDPVVVLSILPTEGPYTGGTEVTVTGSGFVSPVAIELGGVRQRDEAFVSSTEVRFTTAAVSVAACPASGSVPVQGVAVTNLGSGASGSAALTFTYRVPRPLIRRIAPTSGGQLGNTQVNIEGEGFEAPVRVVFAKDGREFAAVVQGTVQPGLVRASSPRVPDDLFPEVDCVTGDNLPGKRFVAVTVDVALTNQATGCADVFANAFTYQPTFPQCRQVGPSP